VEKRAYDAVRAIVERLGGTMVYEREGYPYGAWVIKVAGKQATVVAGGNTSFPELDGLYVPATPQPRHWDDYTDDLVSDAEARLLALLH
jgi:hypothetical protein